MKLYLARIYKAFLVLPRLLFWYSERIIPRSNKKWVFGSWFGEKYSDNSRAMYEYVLKEMPHIKALWLTGNRSVYYRLKQENKPVALLSSIKGKLFSLTAKIAFVTVERNEVNGFYLNGAKIVWLYHGMVIKCIMEDEKRFLTDGSNDKRNIKNKLVSLLLPYDKDYNVGSIIVTSDFFRPYFASAFKVSDDVIWADGYPRNDILFSNESEDIILKYRQLYPTAKFIIHMPTHRLHGLKGKPFNPFDDYGFDSVKFYRALDDGDYVYFYKGHFYDSNSNVGLCNDRFVTITDQDFDILYRLVKDMDILITDYSSIYFDFLLLQKPIILTPFDYDEYITNERPLYYDYKENIIANTVYNWDELINLLNSQMFIEPNDDLINKFHRNRDGLSSKRIVEDIEKKWLVSS